RPAWNGWPPHWAVRQSAADQPVLDDRPAHATGPASQAWTRQAGDALRQAAAAITAARAGHRASPGPDLLDRLRHRYDQAIALGISVNLSRPWHKGNHPGLVLEIRAGAGAVAGPEIGRAHV